MARFLFFIIFLFNYSHASGQLFLEARYSSSDKALIEKIFDTYGNTPDSEKKNFRLANFFEKTPPSDNDSKNIIAAVFLAKKISKDYDGLNPVSTKFFEKALSKTKEIKRRDLEIWVALHYGFYLYTYRKYEDSFPHFMNCIENLNHIKDENVIQNTETYKKIAYFLSTSGESIKAIEYLEKAKEHVPENSCEFATLQFGIGQCYFDLDKVETAEKYVLSSLETSKLCNDEVRYAKSMGSLAQIDLKKGKIKEAIALLKEDIRISEKKGNGQNTMYALTVLGHAYIADKNIPEAEATLQEAQKYALSKSYYKSSEEEISKLMLKIAEIKGDDVAELQARRTLEKLADTLKTLDGKEVIRRVGWESRKAQLQFLLEAEKARTEKESYQKTAAIAVASLMLGLVIFVVRSYKNKSKAEKAEYEKKVLTLLLEKTKSESKLNATSLTINSYREYLYEKNKQIENLQSEIGKIKKSSSFYLEEKSGEMQKLLESHLMTDENWNNFKSAFIKEYPDYYEYLHENFPDLTDSNLRIIILTKLEMSNTEISRISGVTLDAVKKAKQRLRKKYENRYDLLFEIT